MPGRPERVTFTRKAAQRVANVVRDAERGQRDMPAVKFRAPVGGGGVEARVGFISSTWTKGDTKTVTEVSPQTGQTILPVRTFTAINWFATIQVTSGFPKVLCINVGGVWCLIAAECG